MSTLLSRIADDLQLPLDQSGSVAELRHPVPLPSRLSTGELAAASVAALAIAAGVVAPGQELDPDRIALAYRSDRLLRIDGQPPLPWSPYSGFWRACDGWIRTHGNYPHHSRALLRGLGLSDGADAEAVSATVVAASAQVIIEHITDAGGMAVVARHEDPEYDAALRSRPLIELRRTTDAPPRSRAPSASAPLRGIRVLDLTRVIAGPVCTRTLALLGADVLRIDPPHLSEMEWQHLDTGHGKRTARLDARSPQMLELLSQADVVVLGYRPAALERLGLSPERLAEQHPELVVVQLSPWGADHPERAGFDSLVQAESGIAFVESADGETPGALPAQALDHSAGYLLAAGVCAALRHREREGGGWHLSTSLRRVAAELLGMPRRAEPEPESTIDPSVHTREFTVAGRMLTTVQPALPGFSFTAPHPWGSDDPQW